MIHLIPAKLLQRWIRSDKELPEKLANGRFKKMNTENYEIKF